MTNEQNTLQNAIDDLDTAVERECWEDVRIIIAYMREALALCPHGMPLAENICGPCSEGRPNRPAAEPTPPQFLGQSQPSTTDGLREVKIGTLGTLFRVIEDPNMPPDCFIVNGRGFMLMSEGLIELSEKSRGES